MRIQTTSSGVSFPRDIDVDGHTNLDNVSIAGVSTVTGNINVVTAGTDVGLTVTQNGTGNILNLYDGSNLRFYVNQYGNPTVTSGNPVYASTNSSSSVTTTLFSNSAGQGVLQTNSGHSLILGTGAVEKVRITGNGHVNIGGDYAQTTYKLKVTGTSYFDGNLTATGDIDVDGHTNLDNVSIAGVTTFSEDTKFIGALSGRDLQWDKSDNTLEFLDYTAAKFGTDNNLTIYHNAGNNNSYISENGVGSLLIQASDLYLTNTAGEYYVICATDGRVQLNFNGNDKLQTTNTGVKLSSGVSGSVSNILQLDHNGNNNGDGPKITFSRAGTIRTEIESLKNETSNNETDIIFRTTAAGSLGEKLRIDSTGNLKQGTSTTTAFTGGAPSSTQRFLGKKCMQGSVTSTVTLSGSGTGTFDLGRLWLTDDSVTEIFLQVMRNDTALYNSHYCKAFIQKVRGSGMTQGHIQYQNGAHAGFSVSSIQSGGYTASGGASPVSYTHLTLPTTPYV